MSSRCEFVFHPRGQIGFIRMQGVFPPLHRRLHPRFDCENIDDFFCGSHRIRPWAPPQKKWRKVPHIGIAPDFPRFWCVFLFAIHSWVPQIWSPRWVCLNTLGPASDSQWLIIIFSPQEALFWMPPVDETSPFHSRHFWFQVTSNKGG